MSSTVRTVLDVALRTAVLVGVDLGYTWLLDTYDSSPDADIGAGILGFLLIAGIAFLWGLRDGYRRDFARIAVVWIVVGLLSAVASMIRINVGYAPFDGAVFVSDLKSGTPFFTGLVAVPAILGSGFTALLRARPDRPELTKS